MSTFGIPAEHWQRILALLAGTPGVQCAVIFGSRAKGTQRAGSDIDLCLSGAITGAQLPVLRLAYDALYLPWTLDLVIEHELTHAALREHIGRVGQVIFERK